MVMKEWSHQVEMSRFTAASLQEATVFSWKTWPKQQDVYSPERDSTAGEWECGDKQPPLICYSCSSSSLSSVHSSFLPSFSLSLNALFLLFSILTSATFMHLFLHPSNLTCFLLFFQLSSLPSVILLFVPSLTPATMFTTLCPSFLPTHFLESVFKVFQRPVCLCVWWSSVFVQMHCDSGHERPTGCLNELTTPTCEYHLLTLNVCECVCNSRWYVGHIPKKTFLFTFYCHVGVLILMWCVQGHTASVWKQTWDR